MWDIYMIGYTPRCWLSFSLFITNFPLLLMFFSLFLLYNYFTRNYLKGLNFRENKFSREFIFAIDVLKYFAELIFANFANFRFSSYFASTKFREFRDSLKFSCLKRPRMVQFYYFSVIPY